MEQFVLFIMEQQIGAECIRVLYLHNVT